MAKMQKDGVTYEELEELAAQVNFPLNSDDDYLKLFRAARSLGWWPELDRPKMDTKHFWVPPGPDDIRYRPNPWFVPDSAPKKQRVKSAAMNLFSHWGTKDAYRLLCSITCPEAPWIKMKYETIKKALERRWCMQER